MFIKATVKRIKTQATDWKKYLQSIPNKELESKYIKNYKK